MTGTLRHPPKNYPWAHTLVKEHVILGPPGTGKTTYCIGVVCDLLRRGVPSEQIGYLSFTRQAILEVIRRAEGFTDQGYSEEKYPYFRTCHALCYRMLRLKRKEVLSGRDYLELAKLLKLSVSYVFNPEDVSSSLSRKGDRMFFYENLARTRGVPPATILKETNEVEITLSELEELRSRLLEYKQERGKYDFTDMLEQVLEIGEAPESLAYLIVDEVQDLSGIQWAVVRMLASTCEEVWYAGDDDQAIYQWAGASVSDFIEQSGDVTELSYSHRVPERVHVLAKQISGSIEDRRPKTWEPREDAGRVQYVSDMEHVDVSSGRWLILARNTVFLREAAEHCISRGQLFSSRHVFQDLSAPVLAVCSWERLCAGFPVTHDEAQAAYDWMSVRKGVAYGGKKALSEADGLFSMFRLRKDFGLMAEGRWDQALDKLSETHRAYFFAIEKCGTSLSERPRISLSTIHSAKGAESDNVLLFTDMTSLTYETQQRLPEDEARVWYVGVTRAKCALYIMAPRTGLFFPL